MDRSRSRWDCFLEHAALTDVGLRRSNNQDSFAVAVAPNRWKWLERGHLFVVADGMGAHAAGELASKIATDVVPLSYFKHRNGSPPDALLAAVRDANQRIYKRGQASPDFKGMGTTVCVMAVTPQGVFLAHVGDSRAYRLRGHRLEQLTFDHSLIWEMKAAGHIAADDSGSFIPRNIITRSLGPHADVQVDLEGPFSVQAGDTLVLCSDGLSGPLEDDEIGKIAGSMPPDQAARALVDLANLRGGPDNITVIVIRVLEEPDVPESPPHEVGRPDEVGHPKEAAKPLPSIVLGAIGLFALGSLILAAFAQWLLAVISLLAAVGVGGAVIIARSGGKWVPRMYQGQALGRGPYKTIDCQPDEAFAKKLADTVQQLEDAAVRGGWTVDWSRFARHRDQATAAQKAGAFAAAVSEYCRAMSFMVGQLKAQRTHKADGAQQ
ncbi:MAG TPA: serine/threonine-protein phosphatase [Planctomycetes bacterium]|nr:serine/threonine-protein phosphatase [Planctomycetota bacterium]